MKEWYPMLRKRKSVRQYDAAPLTAMELEEIHAFLERLQPLRPEIPVSFRVVKRKETSCMWGEYCLLAYSAVQEGYLRNIGYLLEQADLFFASRGIGACWYGVGRPAEQRRDGKDFVIMLAFGRCSPEMFRRDPAKIRRRELWVPFEEKEPAVAAVLHAACYAPSAVNSQPWRADYRDGTLYIHRAVGFRTPFTSSLTDYMNLIDMGIFLCTLEVALEHEGLAFERKLLPEAYDSPLIPVAEYRLL